MSEQFFFTGGYTENMGGVAEGIGLARTRQDGSLEFLGTAVETSSPSFLVEGSGGVIYATDEGNGRVDAFRRGDGTTLIPLGGRDSSGQYPCHVSVTAGHLYVSNYGDGSIDVFLRESDGSLGELVQSLQGAGSGPREDQDGPHAHATLVVGDTVLSADLGSDQLHVHSVVDDGLVRTGSGSLPAGTGPRDLLHADRLYVLSELDNAILAVDENGAITAGGTTVAEWSDGDHAAALAILDGFIYTGLRGSNRLAIVRADDLSPVAAIPTRGDWPRHLVVQKNVLHVANQRSSTVTSFRIEAGTGMPVPLGEPEHVPSPTYLLPIG